jgi:GNAT superfamily N-acetyltransferase
MGDSDDKVVRIGGSAAPDDGRSQTPARGTDRDARPAPPSDQVEVVVTYLEMHSRGVSERLHHADATGIIRAEQPTVSFYRFLYNGVGGPWSWYERRVIDDAALIEAIHDERVEIYVLYSRGVPAGYVELDRRTGNDVEIAYFGLMPEFIGRGLGRYFLQWALDAAWSYDPDRVWLHTCTLDHPSALGTYQRNGLAPYKQETIWVPRGQLSTP